MWMIYGHHLSLPEKKAWKTDDGINDYISEKSHATAIQWLMGISENQADSQAMLKHVLWIQSDVIGLQASYYLDLVMC